MGKIGDIMTADVLMGIGLAVMLVEKAPSFITQFIPEGMDTVGYLIFLFGLGMAIFNKFTR